MKLTLLFILLHSCVVVSYSQCPNFYDQDGNLSPNPKWVNCSGSDYTLFLLTNSIIGNYTIDWGDGSPIESGTNWNAYSPITHLYLSTVQNYTVTINLKDMGCVVSGLLII